MMGGPYLEAVRDEIRWSKSTRAGSAKGGLDAVADPPTEIVCMQKSADFRAVRDPYLLEGDAIKLPDLVMDTLQLTLHDRARHSQKSTSQKEQVGHGSVRP